MNNTTNNKSEVIENAGQFTVVLPDGCKVMLYGVSQKANAHLIALAGNLNQRFDLSKLEEAIDLLAKAKQVVADRAAGGNMVTSKGYAQDLNFEIQDFLRAITRQPAGEKATNQ